MRRILFLILLLFPVRLEAADLLDTIDTVVQIEAKLPNAEKPETMTGSGVVVHVGETTVSILTAGHVVEGRSDVWVSFFEDGSRRLPVPAKIRWSEMISGGAYRGVRDLAMLDVDLKELGSYRPKAVEVDKSDEKMKINATFTSVGCPNGLWPTAFKGRIVGKGEPENMVCFVPPVIGGRSGSPIFNRNCDRITGIVIWKHEYHGYSTAITPKGIREAIARHPPTVSPD